MQRIADVCENEKRMREVFIENFLWVAKNRSSWIREALVREKETRKRK